MRAIVLSGGGAKGAYQIGLWKALNHLNIKYDIVTGTSIGAMNGMMMVQKDYLKSVILWKNISYEKLYENFDMSKDININYIDKIVKGGIDTSKIKKLIENNYNHKKIYNSKIKFGVVVFDLDNKEKKYITKDNTDKNKLKDYILASATCYPVFKPTIIDNIKYIDGGYYDNLPINLAIELGADEVIAVDLLPISIKQKVLDKSVDIKYITPSSKLDSFLKFESDITKKMIIQGYNDTMKAFNKYEGDIYTFKKGTIYNNYIKYKDKINDIINKNSYIGILKKMDEKTMLDVVEDALEILEIPIEKVYNYKQFNKLMLSKLDSIKEVKINNFDLEKIKELFDRKVIVKYIYKKLEKNDKINAVFNFFTKEYTTAIYLLALRR